MAREIQDVVYQVAIIESERGWGSRVDEIKEFDTKEEADDFVTKFNAQNTAEVVPDWYMKAKEPVRVVRNTQVVP